MPRKPTGPVGPFMFFKSVGRLELIGNTPNVRTLAGALDYAQRWIRASKLDCGITCKRGFVVQFRVSADGFVSLGDTRPDVRPGPVRAVPRQEMKNSEKVS